MRTFVIVTIAALAFASAAVAATKPMGPYHTDASRHCHAADGRIVASSFCAARTTIANCPAGKKACGPTCIPNTALCHSY